MHNADNKRTKNKYCNRNEPVKEKMKEITSLKVNNCISEKEYKYLWKYFLSFRAPIFYGLPKIHKLFKKFLPPRPIVSGFKCISASLSEYVDYFLIYQAKTCKSCIRDTSDFLLKLKSLSTIPSTSILVTIYANSLYTYIDYEEGADAIWSISPVFIGQLPSSHLLLKSLVLKWSWNHFHNILISCSIWLLFDSDVICYLENFKINIINKQIK